VLRGTPFDPFGYTAERRMERRLIRQYEADMARVLADPSRNPEAAVALAELPLSIRGFGPVKAANAEAAAKRRDDLLAAFEAGPAGHAKAAE
jgi:indolepyruvate ferredoxin oxidoreductase